MFSDYEEESEPLEDTRVKDEDTRNKGHEAAFDEYILPPSLVHLVVIAYLCLSLHKFQLSQAQETFIHINYSLTVTAHKFKYFAFPN